MGLVLCRLCWYKVGRLVGVAAMLGERLVTYEQRGVARFAGTVPVVLRRLWRRFGRVLGSTMETGPLFA